jgi:hypothetical protein
MKKTEVEKTTDPLQSSLKVLKKELAKVRTKLRATEVMKEWPAPYVIFELSQSVRSKTDRDALMQQMYKKFVSVCASYPDYCVRLPSYQSCVRLWRKQIMKCKKDDKDFFGR